AHRGYLAWRADAQVDRDGMLHADGHRSTVVLFDWARTTACALTPSSNGIFIQVRSHPGGPGVPPTEYDSFRRGLIESLMAFREPEHGSAVVKQVLTREEAYPGPRMGQAPDLTLVLRDHGFVSVLRAAQPVRRRARVEGTHRPEGVFLAAGEGIRRGAPLPSLSIVDVAPALLYSLGLPIPVDLEGRLPIEAFDPGLLDARPPRLGPPTEAPLANAAEGEGRAAGEGLVLERLRALGYLE
ncbi:MAG: alkaline phosphatase family protein, partial [Actinomycetota bacterium]